MKSTKRTSWGQQGVWGYTVSMGGGGGEKGGIRIIFLNRVYGIFILKITNLGYSVYTVSRNLGYCCAILSIYLGIFVDFDKVFGILQTPWLTPTRRICIIKYLFLSK